MNAIRFCLSPLTLFCFLSYSLMTGCSSPNGAAAPTKQDNNKPHSSVQQRTDQNQTIERGLANKNKSSSIKKPQDNIISSHSNQKSHNAKQDESLGEKDDMAPLKTDDKSDEKSTGLPERSSLSGAKEDAVPHSQHVPVTEHTQQNDAVKSEQENGSLQLRPELPGFSPDIHAPDKFEHPLKHATKLTFMLGEDDHGFYLYGEGPITEGAYSKFLRYVKHYKDSGIELNRIMLHSPGGLVNEGLEIGYYIHDNGWTTDSDQYMQCYSSCGFIYAAGTNKRIQQGAQVGFHRPYFPDKADTDEIKSSMYKEYQPYWQYIGGDKELYDIFMKDYGRDDMFILHTNNISNFMNAEKY